MMENRMEEQRLLRLPVMALREYLNELVTENPMIELDEDSSALSSEVLREAERQSALMEREERDVFEAAFARRQEARWLTPAAEEGETLSAHLLRQLNWDKKLPPSYRDACAFLVESLNSRGYLDEPVDYLAQALGVKAEEVMQALYVVQSLTPTGVGARNLRECLVLQLVQSRHFNQYTLKIVNECLPLLAKGEIAAIARVLGLSEEETREYCGVIRGLNPIPSQGFAGADEGRFVIPEAAVEYEHGAFTVEMNEQPRLRLNREYEAMLQSADSEVRAYLRQNRDRAQELSRALAEREKTLTRVIVWVVRFQEDFLLGRRNDPAPLTVREAAQGLSMDEGTLTTALKDKTVSFRGRPLLLRSLFSTGTSSASRELILTQLRRLIETEDPGHPLSDESLAQAMDALGISVSEEEIARCRAELS